MLNTQMHYLIIKIGTHGNNSSTLMLFIVGCTYPSLTYKIIV